MLKKLLKYFEMLVSAPPYILTYAVETIPLPPPPPPPTHAKNKEKWILCLNSLTRELKIRAVGFVLKKLLTYFEMLVSSPPPPPPPPPQPILPNTPFKKEKKGKINGNINFKKI